MTGAARVTAGLCAALAGCALAAGPALAQTPDQQSAWEAERARQLVEQKARAERVAAERAARRADVMAWVRTLDPLASGGWEFRAAAGDASWAAFSTEHQLQRSGSLVVAWLRQEFAEPQQDPRGGTYLSFVQKVEFDCEHARLRARTLVYYGDNNLRGVTQSLELDPKQATWAAIVPGTLDETNFGWACAVKRSR